MKSGYLFRLTWLSASIVFVGQRLNALGKIIAHQLEHPCANWMDEVHSRLRKQPNPSMVTQLPALRELRNWRNKQ